MAKRKKQPTSVSRDPSEKPDAIQITQAAIATRAHEIYRARGGAHGSDMEDWLQAEREIKTTVSGALTAGKGDVH
jgi:hypothetical protein